MEVNEIVGKFIPLKNIALEQLTSGHIQTTYLVSGQLDEVKQQFILQRLNTEIFPNSNHLIQNHLSLTAYIKAINGESIIPKLISTPTVEYLVNDGQYSWRAQEYIPDTRTHEHISSEEIAYQGANMVGQFTATFADFPTQNLHTIIPGFHTLTKYIKEFESALALDTAQRASSCSPEIKLIQDLSPSMTSRFNHIQALPNRACHSDTKISNILFSKDDKALKIIDLDTVMAGKVVFDYGDMVRSFLSEADENESDLTKINLRDDVFEAMTKGYLTATKTILGEDEKRLFVDGGIVITFEQSVRFLADYLRGDTYYKVKDPSLNLVRAKNQLHLVGLLLQKEKTYQNIVTKYS